MDADGSGEIDFKEFLHVFRKVAAQSKTQKPCRKAPDIKKI